MSGVATSQVYSADDASIDIPQAKRQRIEKVSDATNAPAKPQEGADSGIAQAKADFEDEALIPPSRILLGKLPDHLAEATSGHTQEFDVGISEYISKDLPPIHAIIKQRYAYFHAYSDLA